MEARFVILHSQDPFEILITSELIQAVIHQVDESVVCSVMKSDQSWLLDDPALPHEIITYNHKSVETISSIHDFVPDYLLDIQGTWKSWFFRNRLKVIDFKLNRKFLPPKNGKIFRGRLYQLVTLFDVSAPNSVHELFKNRYKSNWLPESFREGFLMFNLNDLSPQASEESWVEFLGLLETPVVLFGSKDKRPLADRFGKQVGCTLFNTCGDFDPTDYFSMVYHSAGLIADGTVWPSIGEWIGKPVLELSVDASYRREWVEKVRGWIPKGK